MKSRNHDAPHYYIWQSKSKRRCRARKVSCREEAFVEEEESATKNEKAMSNPKSNRGKLHQNQIAGSRSRIKFETDFFFKIKERRFWRGEVLSREKKTKSQNHNNNQRVLSRGSVWFLSRRAAGCACNNRQQQKNVGLKRWRSSFQTRRVRRG